nr:unnamed protein product [Digitaria exilis]
MYGSFTRCDDCALALDAIDPLTLRPELRKSTDGYLPPHIDEYPLAEEGNTEELETESVELEQQQEKDGEPQHHPEFGAQSPPHRRTRYSTLAHRTTIDPKCYHKPSSSAHLHTSPPPQPSQRARLLSLPAADTPGPLPGGTLPRSELPPPRACLPPRLRGLERTPSHSRAGLFPDPSCRRLAHAFRPDSAAWSARQAPPPILCATSARRRQTLAAALDFEPPSLIRRLATPLPPRTAPGDSPRALFFPLCSTRTRSPEYPLRRRSSPASTFAPSSSRTPKTSSPSSTLPLGPNAARFGAPQRRQRSTPARLRPPPSPFISRRQPLVLEPQPQTLASSLQGRIDDENQLRSFGPKTPLPLALPHARDLAGVPNPPPLVTSRHSRSILVHNPQNRLSVVSSLSQAFRGEVWTTLAPAASTPARLRPRAAASRRAPVSRAPICSEPLDSKPTARSENRSKPSRFTPTSASSRRRALVGEAFEFADDPVPEEQEQQQFAEEGKYNTDHPCYLYTD